MSESTWKARLYPTTDEPMRIDRVSEPGATPGNVGICFSGGSSRAMTAAMGQLRALCRLEANGAPLFGQARAVVAISGGSWCLTPFTYLKDDVTDAAYYGAWCAPEDLKVLPPRPGFVDQTPRAGSIDDLHPQSIGQVTIESSFSVPPLSFEAMELHDRLGAASEDIWQSLMARHILKRYALYRPGVGEAPTTTFTLDAAHRATLVADNPGLDPAAVHVCASGPGRVRRPFLIVGSGLLVDDDGDSYRMQVAVHTTPVFTGALGAPDAVDANGRKAGGGGVSSFAFASRPASAPTGDAIAVTIDRFWSLFDAIGTSSVCYAEAVQNFYNQLIEDPEGTRKKAAEKIPDLLLPKTEPTALKELARWAAALNPLYHCWPVRDPSPAEGMVRNGLTDGGTLDNTGITFMLAYADIDRIIAFYNSADRMHDVALGVVGPDGAEAPDTRIFVSEQIPPLFGYQPWVEGKGYRLYAGDPAPAKPQFSRNQVFEATAFAPFLRAMRDASQAGGAWYTAPTVVTAELRVLANPWHGIRGRGGPGDADPRPIRLTLGYLARVRRWRDRLQKHVQRVLGDVDDPKSYGSFPHVSTLRTSLGARTTVLLAHQAAWCVADPANAAPFLAAFTDP